MIASFTVLFSNTQQASAASEKFNLNQYAHNSVSSHLYARAGDRIYFQVTTQNSRHAVGAGVYRVGSYGQHTLVSPRVKTAPAGSGETYDTFSAPSNGFYFLRAACGGNGQTGCKGFGILNTNW